MHFKKKIAAYNCVSVYSIHEGKGIDPAASAVCDRA